MRTMTDDSLLSYAGQPDIPYINAVQLMYMADSLNMSYDDYVFFAKAANRFVYDETGYAEHRASIRAQAQDYLAACVEQAGADTIIGAHW